jgi:hypothetical protein
VNELSKEIRRRFPDFIAEKFRGKTRLPAYLLSDFTDWLGERDTSQLSPELADRVVALSEWCCAQPEDIPSTWMVGVVEELFRWDCTRPILPRIMERSTFLAGADHYKHWVGNENFDKALQLFRSHSPKPKSR